MSLSDGVASVTSLLPVLGVHLLTSSGRARPQEEADLSTRESWNELGTASRVAAK
ncbi:hypothetical protein DPMN_181273 [Dreissena polymorpha]|uniref:Uncharacterized protein n=1 Tax=Dreissena polymorpha TaxID=45954 RepID=A0A9D4DDH9_DREPO|nr:hypothetical protein DPMN_181273 [Dreissena polymorpha]